MSDDIQLLYDALVDSLTGVTGKATIDEALAYIGELMRSEERHNRVQNDTTNKLIGVRRELSIVEAELRELKGRL